jgi:diguanylate cyclase (GGDEF)-like protein
MAATLRPWGRARTSTPPRPPADPWLDALTGLANRRAWFEAIVRASIELDTDPRHVGAIVLIADLDGLTTVNDHLGRDAGDDLLRAAAGVLRRVAPAEAVVARIGGDEFGIVLLGSPATAEELVVAVRHGALASPGVGGRPLSLAVGIASCPPLGTIDDALLAAHHGVLVDKAERRAGRR